MPLSLAVGGLVVIVDIGVSRLYEERRDRVIFVGEQNPAVVWFTGLPRSGKTTVAAWVAEAALVYVVLAVFLAGLMVGRTPEYLGKKIEAREVKYTLIAVGAVVGFALVRKLFR